jgi:hypothetical protein
MSCSTVKAAQYLFEKGASLAGVANDTNIGDVAAFEGFESLWNGLCQEITLKETDGNDSTRN